MRILGITHQYHRLGNAGFAPYNRYQLRHLATVHSVRVVAPVAWTCRFTAARLVEPRRYRNRDGIWVEHPSYYYPPKLLQNHYGHFYLWSVRHAVRRAVEEFQPEVLLSCWAHPDGWATVRLAREYGLPVVIKVIGSDVLVLTRKPRRRLLIAEALRCADAVVAVSRHLADHVISLGVAAERVRVVPEGVDQDLFGPGDQESARARLGLVAHDRRLLFVGNLVLGKGIRVLLEACNLLRTRGISLKCDLVGKGHDESALRKLSARLNLEGIVNFAGSCRQDQLPDWYRASDLVVLPSFSEGIPNVLREAMMCGRRFVATRVGGIPEITRPSLGLLVDPGDPKQLADAIAIELSENQPSDRQSALELNISWEKSAQLLEQTLRSVVEQSGRPACVTSGVANPSIQLIESSC